MSHDALHESLRLWQVLWCQFCGLNDDTGVPQSSSLRNKVFKRFTCVDSIDC